MTITEYIAQRLSKSDHPLLVKACSCILNNDHLGLAKMKDQLVAYHLTEKVAAFKEDLEKYKNDIPYALPKQQLLPLTMLKESAEDFEKNYKKLSIEEREQAAKALAGKGASNLPIDVYTDSPKLVITKDKLEKVSYQFSTLEGKKKIQSMMAKCSSMQGAKEVAHELEKMRLPGLEIVFGYPQPQQQVKTASLPSKDALTRVLGKEAERLFVNGKLDKDLYETLPLSDKILIRKYNVS